MNPVLGPLLVGNLYEQEPGAVGALVLSFDADLVSFVVGFDVSECRTPECRETLRIRAVDVETSGNAGGSFYGRGARGTSRIVVDEDRRVLVGATFVGSEVADYVHAATIAIVGEVPLERLWHAVPSFPTRSELWLRLLEKYGL